MSLLVRIPKPSYLFRQLSPREKPDDGLYQTLMEIANFFQLGPIENCYRAPKSNSLNVIAETGTGKYVFRAHSLSEETVAHEYQVLQYLEARNFPAPQMVSGPGGEAWFRVGENLCSVYKFVEGYSAANFIWWPAARNDLITQAGRALAAYHTAVKGLRPAPFKWDGYRPTEHRRWREGEMYRNALREIHPLIEKSTATRAVDQFARTHIADVERMLQLEEVVEGCSDLSKLVIHGDYAPWNVLYRAGQAPFILDFNSARLDLQIFDIILATLFFAWRGNRLDMKRAIAFQAGYAELGRLSGVDTEMASAVFQWVMGRSMAERLRSHYLEERFIIESTTGLERFYTMCMFAEQHPKQIVAGLTG
jgi:Ser/Thr protein kinase RdoA (MazF antagonist)